MKITLNTLEQHGACVDQCELFAVTFPDGAEVNSRNFTKARKAGLSVLWLFWLVPEDQRAEYKKARDAALAKYEKTRDTARAEYEKDTAAAWAKYKKARDAARAEYEKNTAAALIRALK